MMRIRTNTQVVLIQLIATVSNRKAKNKRFVVFCPEKVAISAISGIITTTLGKTATPIEISRAQKDGYITPKYAFLPNRRRAFFLASCFAVNMN
jgi:hypothetical protein